MTINKTFNLLIGVTGSVATIKLIELIHKIHSSFPKTIASEKSDFERELNVDIRMKIVMTEHAKHFVKKETLIEAFQDKNIEIYDDNDEWLQWTKMTDPVLHIELRKWAHMFLLAPLDANTMGKMSNGICDNLITCIVRAWDISRPLLYCPAMNVHMYKHPLTKEHMSKMKSFGYICVDAVEKMLACGDFGIGAMASVDAITDNVMETMCKRVFIQNNDLV